MTPLKGKGHAADAHRKPSMTKYVEHTGQISPPLAGAEGYADGGALGAELVAERSHGTERWSFLRRLLLSADLLAGTAAGVAACGVTALDLQAMLSFASIVALLWPSLLFVCGLYTQEDLRSWASGVAEAPRALFAALASSWPIYGVATLLGVEHAGAAALIAAFGCLVLGAAGRGLARAIAHQSEPLRQRTVIVGSGVVAGQVAHKLTSHPEFGLVPVGVVDDDVHDEGHPDLPTLGRLDDLSEILARRSVDRVIIAFSRASHPQLLASLRACRDHGVAVDVVPRLFEFLSSAHAIDRLGGLPLLSIGPHRFSPSARAAKRALDITVAGGALVVLSPLLAVIAGAIKLESRGTAFFCQSRAGRGGHIFSMLKFRSMFSDADARAEEFRNDGVIVKGGYDPRVTRVGALARRFSLDEMPQLFNVLRGEMSLVGPRPLVLSEAAALDERWHERRLDLKPGMTGLWQVSGRSRIPFDEMLRFDYEYVSGWSLARDVEILLQTVPAVLTGRGAY